MMKIVLSTLALGALAVTFSTGGSLASESGWTAAGKAPLTLDRNKPRIPGGSGCDDPQDVREHPECRALKSLDGDAMTIARNKPRIPGGSGCDDPQDVREHPECRA